MGWVQGWVLVPEGSKALEGAIEGGCHVVRGVRVSTEGVEASFPMLAVFLPAMEIKETSQGEEGNSDDGEPLEAAKTRTSRGDVIWDNSAGGEFSIGVINQERGGWVTVAGWLGPFPKARTSIETGCKTICECGNNGVGLGGTERGGFSPGKGLHLEGVGLTAIGEGFESM